MLITNLAEIFFKNLCQIGLESASALSLPFVSIDMRQTIGLNANSSATALHAEVTFFVHPGWTQTYRPSFHLTVRGLL